MNVKAVEKTIDDLRLIDDALFRLVAARKEVCQEILRTLLDDTLTVLSVTPQERMVSLHREVTLDVVCRMLDKSLCNIEIQTGQQHDDVRRCRYHASILTVNNTKKGAGFKDIPDVKILYISEYDVLKTGRTLTHVKRVQMNEDGRYVPVDDGEDLFFANTAVKENSVKSDLLQLFLRKDTFQDERFPALSNAVYYFKEMKKGRETMSSAVEEYAKEYALNEKLEMIKVLIQKGTPIDVIQEASHINLETLQNLLETIQEQ